MNKIGLLILLFPLTSSSADEKLAKKIEEKTARLKDIHGNGEGEIYIKGPTGIKQQTKATVQVETPEEQYLYTEEVVVKHPENSDDQSQEQLEQEQTVSWWEESLFK